MFQAGNCRKFCVHMQRQSAIKVSLFLLWKHSIILRKFNEREQKLLSNVQIKHFCFWPYNCIWKLSVKGVLLPPTFITASLHLLRQANTWQLTFSEIQWHKMFSANKKSDIRAKKRWTDLSNFIYFSFSQKKIGRTESSLHEVYKYVPDYISICTHFAGNDAELQAGGVQCSDGL